MGVTKNKKVATVSLKRLQKLLCPVTTAGAQLSNVAYNLKQRDDVPADAREILTELQRAWDDAIRAIPNKWKI